MRLLEHVHERWVVGRRARRLGQFIADLVPPGAGVLDVGCGDGQVAWLIARQRPDVRVEGLDVLVRDDARIRVRPFDGVRIPREDRSCDVVLLVDVLHHAHDPALLLGEAVRVAQGHVVIKDHLLEGRLAEATLRFMDGVGNRRHGVALPYHYWTLAQWREAFDELAVTVDAWRQDLGLYRWPFSLVFGRSLHFLARLSVGARSGNQAAARGPGASQVIV